MKRVLLVSLFVAALALPGCGERNSGKERGAREPNPAFAGAAPGEAMRSEGEIGAYGGTLALALPQNPKSFNPVLASETSTLQVISQVVYKGLVEYDNVEQRETPGLAKSWEASADGRVWRFRLRRGVAWSDGAPFTVEDALFTFEVTFDPKIAAAGRDLFVHSDGTYPVVEKAGEDEIVFRLKEPNALFLSAVGATLLIPRHKLEAVYRAGGFNEALLASAPPEEIVGLGPYRVRSYASDQRIELERNPHYWKVDGAGRRLPYLDRVIFLIVPDANAATLRFQAGEIDMLWELAPETVDLLRRGEGPGQYKVHDLGASFNTTFLVFNQDTARYRNAAKLRWFRETRFRQAISYAIDRDAIVRTVFLGHAAPLFGFVSPANKQWHTAGLRQYPHDPGKARELLREIGIEDRDADGKLEDAQGKAIRFTIHTNANNATRVGIGAQLKEQLGRLGIDVSFQPLEFNLLIEKLAATRDFDAIILGWQAAVPPDPVLSQSGLLPTGAAYGAFPNQKAPGTEWEKRLQERLLANAQTVDPQKRKEAFAEAMRIWSEHLPEIDLVAGRSFAAAKNRFGNFKPSPLANYTYWNLDELYIK